MVDPRLINLLCRILGEEHRSKITWETAMEDIENWDSLTFIDIILAVEREFGLEIPPESAAEMTNVAAIQKIIQETVIARSPERSLTRHCEDAKHPKQSASA